MLGVALPSLSPLKQERERLSSAAVTIENPFQVSKLSMRYNNSVIEYTLACSPRKHGQHRNTGLVQLIDVIINFYNLTVKLISFN